MQKALVWLDEHGVEYYFHDYKKEGIDRSTLETWLTHFAADKLINTKGTTFRGLTETEKAGIGRKPSAIKLMLAYNSVIKRPVWDLGDGRFFLGWDEKLMAEVLLP